MDVSTILNYVSDFIPTSVIVAAAVAILLIYLSQKIACVFEKWIEAKKNKQIRIFDHKKIWLSLFWSVVLSVALALGSFIEWREALFYAFCILGGSGFLYNMVRIMTGTLVDIGAGKIPAGDLEGILEAGNRSKAGHTAPPQGLYMAQVYFSEEELREVLCRKN